MAADPPANAPEAPAADGSGAGAEVTRHHPRWALGNVPVTPNVMVVVALLLPTAGVAAELGPWAVLVAWTAAAGLLVRWLLHHRPVLSIDGQTAELRSRSGGPAIDVVQLHEISQLRVVDRSEASAIAASPSAGGWWIDAKGLRTIPPEDGPADEPAGLLITTGRGQARTIRLWPLWRSEDAPLLLGQLTTPEPTGRRRTVAELPAPAGPTRTSWRAVPPAVWRRAVLVGLAPIAAAALLRLLSALLRATVMDVVLVSRFGASVTYVSRSLELLVVFIGVIGGLVAAGLVVAWGGQDRTPPLGSIARLAAWRTGWALWQLKLWLVGTTALHAVLGVAGQRVVVAVAAASVAIPAVQLTRELARRTVEETWGGCPPMTRISIAPQLLPLLGTLIAVLALRI